MKRWSDFLLHSFYNAQQCHVVNAGMSYLNQFIIGYFRVCKLNCVLPNKILARQHMFLRGYYERVIFKHPSSWRLYRGHNIPCLLFPHDSDSIFYIQNWKIYYQQYKKKREIKL